MKNTYEVHYILQAKKTWLKDKIKILEMELCETTHSFNKLSSNQLKNLLSVHPSSMNYDVVGVSSSHDCMHLNRNMFVKQVNADEVKFKVACMNNGKYDGDPKFMNSIRNQTSSNFVPTCYHCGIIGNIRPKYFLLRSQRPWTKQNALMKDEPGCENQVKALTE